MLCACSGGFNCWNPVCFLWELSVHSDKLCFVSMLEQYTKRSAETERLLSCLLKITISLNLVVIHKGLSTFLSICIDNIWTLWFPIQTSMSVEHYVMFLYEQCWPFDNSLWTNINFCLAWIVNSYFRASLLTSNVFLYHVSSWM